MYEVDVHLFLTIYLAEQAGFLSSQAIDLGSETQRLDDPKDPRTAMVGKSIPLPNLGAMRQYHFPSETQYKALHNTALINSSTIWAWGEAIHAMQDTYGHSEGVDDRNWIYHGDIMVIKGGGLLGHAFQGHRPDHTWRDVPKAMKAAKETYDYLREYAVSKGISSFTPWDGAVETKVKRFMKYSPKLYKEYFGGFVPVDNVTAAGYKTKGSKLNAMFMDMLPDYELDARAPKKPGIARQLARGELVDVRDVVFDQQMILGFP